MPTIKRPCARCRVVLLTATGLCPACTRARDIARGSPTARGLGYRYQRKRARILARDGAVCWRCGQPATTVDHIIPRARGGTDDDDNLRAACARCNYGRR